jgi:hypothetical protein
LRYEYRVIWAGGTSGAQDNLNKYGAEGFRLVKAVGHASGTYYVMEKQR